MSGIKEYDALKECTLLSQPSPERSRLLFFYKVFNIQIYFFLKTDWGQPGVSVILRSKQIISTGITTSAVSSLLFHCLLHNWRILTSHQASLIIINPPIRLTIKGAIWLVKVCPRSLMKRRTQTNSSRLTARQSKHLETGFLTQGRCSWRPWMHPSYFTH